MYKIGIIGERDSVLCFMALGYGVFDTGSPEEAKKALREWVKSGEYAVIFITEAIARQIEDETEKYKDMPLPAIISLPGIGGREGYGMENIRSAALRAIGADILFGKDE